MLRVGEMLRSEKRTLFVGDRLRSECILHVWWMGTLPRLVEGIVRVEAITLRSMDCLQEQTFLGLESSGILVVLI